jgi:hypothetical protein
MNIELMETNPASKNDCAAQTSPPCYYSASIVIKKPHVIAEIAIVIATNMRTALSLMFSPAAVYAVMQVTRSFSGYVNLQTVNSYSSYQRFNSE